MTRAEAHADASRIRERHEKPAVDDGVMRAALIAATFGVLGASDLRRLPADVRVNSGQFGGAGVMPAPEPKAIIMARAAAADLGCCKKPLDPADPYTRITTVQLTSADVISMMRAALRALEAAGYTITNPAPAHLVPVNLTLHRRGRRGLMVGADRKPDHG